MPLNLVRALKCTSDAEMLCALITVAHLEACCIALNISWATLVGRHTRITAGEWRIYLMRPIPVYSVAPKVAPTCKRRRRALKCIANRYSKGAIRLNALPLALLVSAAELEFSKTTDSSTSGYRRFPPRIEFCDAFELLRGERTHHVAHLPVAVIAPLTRRKGLHLA